MKKWSDSITTEILLIVLLIILFMLKIYPKIETPWPEHKIEHVKPNPKISNKERMRLIKAEIEEYNKLENENTPTNKPN